MSEPKQIATLPPIEELRDDVPRSPRTGEPRRPVVLGVASTLMYLAVIGAGVVYGLHWWLAADMDRYASSAHLVEWLAPKPGTWQSLLIEGGLAAAVALAAGAAGVAGFQAWNGWRWARWAGLVAAALMGGYLAITHWWGAFPLALTVVGAALLFLPPVTRYFREWAKVRSEQSTPYRRPERIFYGRLPRFR